MRLTVRLDEAASLGISLEALIEDAPRERMARLRRSMAPRRLNTRGRGLQPGVDLDDTAGLLDLMDE